MSKPWENWSEEKLLELRFCDLGLTMDDAPAYLVRCIDRLYEELAGNGIKLRPHFWLSNEWFTPDGVPGIAIPFYLFHPTLFQLERSKMLEVEGSTEEHCMRILRHETGHAVENGYELRRKRIVHKVFGRSSLPYPETYDPRPYSKRFVIHLDGWYAQSHPDEDFAETFAVWLTPGSNWQERYQGWPALKKLELMDALMEEVKGKPPSLRTKRKEDPIDRMKETLGEFYEERIDHFGLNYPDFYDRDLKKLFVSASEAPKGPKASIFLRKNRKEVCKEVARWAETYRYLVNGVVKDMINRAQQLDLRLSAPEEETLVHFKLMMAVQVVNILHRGEHRVAL